MTLIGKKNLMKELSLTYLEKVVVLNMLMLHSVTVEKLACNWNNCEITTSKDLVLNLLKLESYIKMGEYCT